MPRRLLSFSRALLCSSLLAVTGCQNTSREPDKVGAQNSALNQAQQATFSSPRDDLGREITLKAPAQRVVVVGPGAVETIYTLGAGSRIVGRDSFANFPAGIKKVAVVADYRGPFIEACVAARPDIVLLQGETWGRERVENWQAKIGVPVAALVATKLGDVQKDADKIAVWLGVQKRNLGLKPEPSNAPKQTAFIEAGRSPLWTAGKGTLVSDVVEQSHFKNVAADVAGYKAFSKEALLKRQPDVYIATGQPAEKARIVADLKRDAALSSLKCVQRGQVLVIPGDFLLRPGPRLRQGIQMMQQASKQLAAS